MAGSEGQPENAPLKSGNKCGFCPSNVIKSGVVCKICKTSYHASCGRKVKSCCDANLVNSEGGELINDGSKVSSQSYPSSPNSAVDLCEYYKLEVGLLKSLLKEKENRIVDLLKINNLLEEKIEFMENAGVTDSSKLPKQKINADNRNKSFSDVAKSSTDKESKTNKVPYSGRIW